MREASQTEIVKLAERQAQEIVDDARRQARETRLEMEDWADGILSTLEVNLDKFLPGEARPRAAARAARRSRSSPAGPRDAPRPEPARARRRHELPLARAPRRLAPLRPLWSGARAHALFPLPTRPQRHVVRAIYPRVTLWS